MSDVNWSNQHNMAMYCMPPASCYFMSGISFKRLTCENISTSISQSILKLFLMECTKSNACLVCLIDSQCSNHNANKTYYNQTTLTYAILVLLNCSIAHLNTILYFPRSAVSWHRIYSFFVLVKYEIGVTFRQPCNYKTSTRHLKDDKKLKGAIKLARYVITYTQIVQYTHFNVILKPLWDFINQSELHIPYRLRVKYKAMTLFHWNLDCGNATPKTDT